MGIVIVTFCFLNFCIFLVSSVFFHFIYTPDILNKSNFKRGVCVRNQELREMFTTAVDMTQRADFFLIFST